MTDGIREVVFDAISNMASHYDAETEHNNGPEKTRELTEAFALFMLSVSDDYSHVAYQIMTETMAKTYREFLYLGDEND